ncbi:hypothetical protein SLINC_2322 [Streptomyces lincolnensis]|uniref:Uncharacterized protein n=1 Tax=Streptomyces lincolnensis TaxID=1915 RepID=A0A1B1M7E3_STRLN|nr:hypothetical protein [Streptomyces lincolnensis]ANS64546.1 hypothetical protein SLINC_2322 [Streptomyces lincolnensis]QMV06370.1 hypothetical protein GJU35_12255 [Streptomyces lincolnensis]
MTGIGPVEPVNSAETGESYDVIGADAPRLTDRLAQRWHGLPRRARQGVLAATAAAATAIGALVLAPDSNPAPPLPPRPVPWPANVTTWHYAGLAAPLNSAKTSGRYRFAVTVDSGPPVTLTVTGAAFPGLRARAVPESAFTVRAGTTRRITVEISVSDCSGLPLNADLSLLDVTLRNTRAIQRHSFIFGRAHSRDLSALLNNVCGPPPAAPGPRPTGSAGSQHAD